MNTRQSTPWLGFMILLLAAGCSQTEPFSAKETFPSLNNGGSPPPPPPRSPGPPTTMGLTLTLTSLPTMSSRVASSPRWTGTPQAGGEASDRNPVTTRHRRFQVKTRPHQSWRGTIVAGPRQDPRVPGDEPDENCDHMAVLERNNCQSAGCHATPVAFRPDLTNDDLHQTLLSAPSQSPGCNDRLLIDPRHPGIVFLRRLDRLRLRETMTSLSGGDASAG